MKITFVLGLLTLVAVQANASWRTVQPAGRVEMAFAVSDRTTETTTSGAQAVLGVGCESDGHKWVYVRLSDVLAKSVKAV